MAQQNLHWKVGEQKPKKYGKLPLTSILQTRVRLPSTSQLSIEGVLFHMTKLFHDSRCDENGRRERQNHACEKIILGRNRTQFSRTPTTVVVSVTPLVQSDVFKIAMQNTCRLWPRSFVGVLDRVVEEVDALILQEPIVEDVDVPSA